MISKWHILNCIPLVTRKKNKLVSGRENISICQILTYKVLSLTDCVNQLRLSLFFYFFP